MMLIEHFLQGICKTGFQLRNLNVVSPSRSKITICYFFLFCCKKACVLGHILADWKKILDVQATKPELEVEILIGAHWVSFSRQELHSG